MRKTLTSAVAAVVLLAGVHVAPATADETGTGRAETGNAGSSATKPGDNTGKTTEGTPAPGNVVQFGSTDPDFSKNVPPRPTLGAPAEALEPLNPAPYTDPFYIDPDKNPFKKVSSSEMFLDWTKDMEEGEGKDFVQAWAVGSAVPDTANPAELLKQEIQGSAMMSSGLFTGDWAQSSRGSSQASSVVIPIFLGVLVVGQVLELIGRGLRMAGVDYPKLPF